MMPTPLVTPVLAVCLALTGAGMTGAAAQQVQGTAQAAARLFTLNQDGLYSKSMFGKRVLGDVAQKRKALEAENKKFEAKLKAEEQELTDKRPTLEPKEFRKLADAFDARVEKIRADQARKSKALTTWADGERTRFFNLAFPILLKMAGEVNALAILDERLTIISAEEINLTDKAVARMDAEFGDGATANTAPEPPAKTPAKTPEKTPATPPAEPPQTPPKKAP